MVILPARMSARLKTSALVAKLMATNGLGAAEKVAEMPPSERTMTEIRIQSTEIARPEGGRASVLALTVTSPNGF